MFSNDPNMFLFICISTADIVTYNPIWHIGLGILHNDDTVVTGKKVYQINQVNVTIYDDDDVWVKMDSGPVSLLKYD